MITIMLILLCKGETDYTDWEEITEWGFWKWKKENNIKWVWDAE